MPELDQSTLNRICEHYGIRPLRAAERCDKCGGRGSIPSPALGGVRCPDCDQGIRVLDEGLLLAALADFWNNRDRHLSPEQLGYFPGVWDASCWKERHNTCWKQSIEAAVLDWEPTGDDVLNVLLPKIAEEHAEWDFDYFDISPVRVRWKCSVVVHHGATSHVIGEGDTPMDAILAAAAATLPEGDDASA